MCIWFCCSIYFKYRNVNLFIVPTFLINRNKRNWIHSFWYMCVSLYFNGTIRILFSKQQVTTFLLFSISISILILFKFYCSCVFNCIDVKMMDLWYKLVVLVFVSMDNFHSSFIFCIFTYHIYHWKNTHE